MQIKFITASHTDHGLDDVHWAFIQAAAAEWTSPFMITTLELPEDLPVVENGLHGPTCGDEPVPEGEVEYVQRVSGEGRDWKDRMCRRPKRPTRQLSVVAIATDPDDPDTLTMFTAYGGPLAPQHADDPSNRDPEGSREFWAAHALSL